MKDKDTKLTIPSTKPTIGCATEITQPPVPKIEIKTL